jgi:hypothetical protein
MNLCPYTDELQRLLPGRLKHLSSYNTGRSGDLVLGPYMRLRLSDAIDEAENAEVTFDWAVIMAD